MFKELKTTHLDIDTTGECNFACKYCYHNDKKFFGDNMEPKTKKRLIEILQKEKIRISFMGGEPLVRFENIVDIVDATNTKGFSITSNLSLLDDKKYKYLKKHNGKIHPSIDGNKESHDKFRIFKNGDGTFDAIKKNLKYVFGLNRNATARITVHPDTVHMLYNSVVSLCKLGFRHTAPMLIYEANWTDSHWKTYKEQLEKLAKFNFEHPHIYIKNFHDVIRGIGKHGKRIRRKKCGAGWNLFAVSTNGLIYPCHRFTSTTEKEWCLGSIFDGFNMNKLNQFRSAFKSISKKCETCDLFFSCNTGCPYVSWDMHKDLNKIVINHCKYMRTCFGIAMNLYERIKNKKNVYKDILSKHKQRNKEISNNKKKE